MFTALPGTISPISGRAGQLVIFRVIFSRSVFYQHVKVTRCPVQTAHATPGLRSVCPDRGLGHHINLGDVQRI